VTARQMKPIRVVHVITGLGVGGAETMLAKLLEAEAADGIRRTLEVICLDKSGPLAPRIEAAGVGVRSLNMASRRVAGLFELLQRLRQLKPDVVQCWMYHADLIGGLAALLTVPRARRLWSIRASFMPRPAPLLTRLVIRTCAVLSWVIPHRIISCSSMAAAIHRERGYRAGTIVVIPNGFDLARFAPDEAAKSAVRNELRIPADAQLIGCVARADPQKDFPTLFRAFGLLARDNDGVHLMLVGKGLVSTNADVTGLIPAGLQSRVHLLGPRQDVPRLTAALDVATLTSAYGEGFPNVIGEALACGVPCVATDVGDCRDIVDTDGFVVPIGDSNALASAWAKVLRLHNVERSALSANARARAVRQFDIHAVARRYWAQQDAVVARVAGTACPSHSASLQ
jgi:glycosyltransferase involved in cell wall biosynthesis